MKGYALFNIRDYLESSAYIFWCVCCDSKCLGCVYVQRESKSSDFKGVSGAYILVYENFIIIMRLFAIQIKYPCFIPRPVHCVFLLFIFLTALH